MGNISNPGKDNIYPIAGLNLFQVFLRMFQVQLRTTQTCRDVTTGILSTVCVLNYHPWESWTAAVKGKSQEQARTARGTDAIPRPLSPFTLIYCLLKWDLSREIFIPAAAPRNTSESPELK